MPYFYGSFEHALDDRGRVAVPARFRRALQDGGVVRAGNDGCAEIYTHETFETETERRLGDAGGTRRSSRRVRRAFLAGAFEVELDRQGRVLLPQGIRTECGLDGRAIVIGCGDYIEIWDPARWNSEAETLVDDEDGEDEA